MDEELGENPDTEKQDEKSISSDLIRGHINTIILRSLSDGDKYGYEIIAEIEEKSRGQYSLKQPSLYSALKRLESQGYVTSYWGGSVGGGRRKYFSLTPEGQAIAEQNRAEWEYSRTIIDSLISDQDFDFSNPAPTAVNMRVLKETTSRVPSREGGEDGVDYSPTFGDVQNNERLEELERQNAELQAEKEAREKELEEIRAREETLRAENEERAKLLEERERELGERQREAEEERRRSEEIINERTTIIEEQRSIDIREREEAHLEERARYEEMLRERDEKIEEERLRHEQELEAQEERILREQEALFRQREQELLHQNYLNLVNAPPAQQDATEDYDHYTPPVAAETEDVASAQEEESVPPRDYRTIVHEMYASSVQGTSKPIENNGARSLGGIDFQDIEARAARDGIRIYTSSGNTNKTKEEVSASVVHKGKALFLSALLVFFIIVAEGAIVLGLKRKYSIPIALPCIMWGIGLALLLATGLAYANHYGERALRKSSPAIINAVVCYALTVIVTLIVALSANIDFHSPSALASFIAIPIIFLFGIVIFGVTYWLQIKPKK